MLQLVSGLNRSLCLTAILAAGTCSWYAAASSSLGRAKMLCVSSGLSLWKIYSFMEFWVRVKYFGKACISGCILIMLFSCRSCAVKIWLYPVRSWALSPAIAKGKLWYTTPQSWAVFSLSWSETRSWLDLLFCSQLNHSVVKWAGIKTTLFWDVSLMAVAFVDCPVDGWWADALVTQKTNSVRKAIAFYLIQSWAQTDMLSCSL